MYMWNVIIWWDQAQGQWEISLTGEGISDSKVTIEVKEYVLDRFEVIVEAPKSVAKQEMETSGLSVTVYGQYTYGEKVSGKLRS